MSKLLEAHYFKSLAWARVQGDDGAVVDYTTPGNFYAYLLDRSCAPSMVVQVDTIAAMRRLIEAATGESLAMRRQA